MDRSYKIDEWKIIEEEFKPEKNRASESVFSIGNGHMGQRANFEERYSGDSLPGSYIAGIYYPDKTRVGWWKIGYPEYFAKVLNSPNWIGIDVSIDDEPLDLAKCEILSFRRELNMKEGILARSFRVRMNNGIVAEVNASRFVSLDDHELGAIQYSVRLPDQKARLGFNVFVDGNVVNEDANYGEIFWNESKRATDHGTSLLVSTTRKTNFTVAFAVDYALYRDKKEVDIDPASHNREKFAGHSFEIEAEAGEEYTLYKFAAILSSENNPVDEIGQLAMTRVREASSKGFSDLLDAHKEAWQKKWDESDIVIKGDPAAQQGIRFNIFHLYQTYQGDDKRLNIGPKGFTGEKYGGTTYWDTEAFAFPFYLMTSDLHVARNLLLYRYRHLGKAIENAGKLGFEHGAALYPMVTINGEECHNEWEITFEEIHRNGAIAYAIFNYIEHTGDSSYLEDYGLEVLIALSRFWRQRVNYSELKMRYVILGVTGPNEYENNVNNNWYTNKVAWWTLQYTLECIGEVKSSAPAKYKDLAERTDFDEEIETMEWKEIIKNLYFPYDDERDIFLQQEGYLDKLQQTASDIRPEEKPINQHWSWDRILRSCFIKQADVVQGLYFFEEEYDTETIRRNFDFYEPRTVHESSLSPSVYSLMASRIGWIDKAYELYLRTARLDIDDINKEVKEGLHITSMAGTWLSIVEGFAGLKVKQQKLYINPLIPEAWEMYSFMIRFMNNLLKISISEGRTEVENLSDKEVSINVAGEKKSIGAGNIEFFKI
ncbi:MAG: family 65 glycosyl hydrolase domain-containing protein [Bacteroidota bacterium]|nr:family 65 glycosyl hydrolase domain-containing protein [Bacteroidota bacterium]